jgi:trimeric autotransporter adhesin
VIPLLMFVQSAAACYGQTVSSLALSSGSVTGGGAVTAKLTLSGKAPAAGIDVALQSTSGTVAVPAMVHIPAQAVGASFKVSTVAVKQDTVSTITASAGGLSATANLTVLALPSSPS